MSQHSRLQKQVLGLYRELLRAGRGKPGAEARVRAEFRQNACLPRSDVLRIEYLYRRGRRQLLLLRSAHAKSLGAFVRPMDPPGEPAALGALPDGSDQARSHLGGARTLETPPDEPQSMEPVVGPPLTARVGGTRLMRG
ncbi:LOW QUALITY PROTEIN: succinate dehydrogenase assembly factor 1, mitochondrial [Echinops telfairi]|uniref:LOW QUALITY PROTEIN: succinate dehydrogenase assembly factor 1, mitochondrial n=1 Tax=Echinops telfairi TaxID=9371 RepID=A0AC55DAS1_ECHTE|nr:LOW QUALITY PROTEIN: succinate dehydrogenase assembly factor 1, mitochondrial [Echinops telfairi]